MTLLGQTPFRASWRRTTIATLSMLALGTHTASAAEVGPWGPVASLRDDTDAHAGSKPAGGWYVTPIHAVLQARSGKVLVSGTGRIAQDSCNGTTQRGYGLTYLLDPAQIDAINDGATLLVQPIDEQARNDDERHVLYCSGHAPLADGRVLYVGGTDYPRVFPPRSPPPTPVTCKRCSSCPARAGTWCWSELPCATRQR